MQVSSFINDSLYSFDGEHLIKNYALKWDKMNTIDKPTTGLMNYGMHITSTRKLIIYGGYTEKNPSCLSNFREFHNHNDLWLLNLNDTLVNFISFDWIDTEGGYSKIVSLGDEVVAIFNPFFETQVIIIDFEKMISYDVQTIGFPEALIRSGFGVAGNNAKDFILYGGYNIYEGKVKDINNFDILAQITFLNMEFNESQNYTVPLIVGTTVISLVGIVLATYYLNRYRRRIKVSESYILEQRRMEYALEVEEALENSKKYVENRIANLSADPDFTHTLVPPNNSVLCVPGYKRAKYGTDFRNMKFLTRGGFGEVHLGTLLNVDPKHLSKTSCKIQDKIPKFESCLDSSCLVSLQDRLVLRQP
jgi:hypothetical protein